MESFEKLQSLSDIEKLKFVEVLIESLKPVSDSSDVPVKNTLGSLIVGAHLGNLIDGKIVSPEGKSRKKQRTLDSWLIKPKDVSSNKSSTGTFSLSEELNSDINNVTKCSSHPTLNYSDVDNTECSSQPTLNYSVVDNVTESSSQPTPNYSNDASSLNSSKSKEKSSKNAKHPPYKSDKVNSIGKNVQISLSNIVESTCSATKKYNLRTKKKCSEPSQLSKPQNLGKNSECVDNISDITQSQTTNNCEIPDVSPENIIVLNHSKPAKRNDCQKVDCSSLSFDKNTKNRRSKKSNLNFSNSVELATKLSNNMMKRNNLDVNKTDSLENEQDNTDSMLLSNYEAFQLLEAECSRIDLNILEILQDENVQNILNNPEKFSNEAIVLIGSMKSNNNVNLPVVHLIESRERLCDNLNKL